MTESHGILGRLSVRQIKLLRAFFTLSMVCGIAFMLYPAAWRLYSMYVSVRLAEKYQQTVDECPAQSILDELDRAYAYNRAHAINTIEDPFGDDPSAQLKNEEYYALLDPMGNGVMGYLDIPKINQRLNIYHGTDDEALERGVGHLQGTSLPVGGEGTHCVISGHRGLPSAKIFTDLDRLNPGDRVQLHVLGIDMTYAVDNIEVVTPDVVDSLAIVPGADLLTLVTCTPYAVNTHRMLVHCHRVPYSPEESPTTMGLVLLTPMRIVILMALLVGLLLAPVVRRARLRRRRADAGRGRHAR